MATPTLRSRHPPGDSKDASPADPNPSAPTPKAPSSTRFSVLDILRVLGGLFLLSSTLSYLVTSNSILWNYRPALTRPARLKAWLRGPLRLSPSQLALYNGTDAALPIYLALNGSIYDVSASPHLYGPGGSYHFFAGRDATRAFVTGCFAEDLTGDLRGVEEMFIPVDDDEDEEGNAGVVADGTAAKTTAVGAGDAAGGDKAGGDEEARRVRRERKVRRERERRVARRKVFDAVEGWRKMFDGGKEGKYFWVGRVVGAEVGERRALCEKARKARPKRGGRVEEE